MLRSHAELAESLGVPKQNILIGDNGTVFEFTNRSGKINGKVQSGAVFVDGLGVGDVGNIVIRDRQQLAQDGVFIVVIALERGATRSRQVPISYHGDSFMSVTARSLCPAQEAVSKMCWNGATRGM